MKKITRTTIKNFVAREAANNNLYIKIKSTFNGMTDGVEGVKSEFKQATATTRHENSLKYNLGFDGIWLVGNSRDSFEAYADDNYIGYEVWNCCGSFILAMHR